MSYKIYLTWKEREKERKKATVMGHGRKIIWAEVPFGANNF